METYRIYVKPIGGKGYFHHLYQVHGTKYPEQYLIEHLRETLAGRSTLSFQYRGLWCEVGVKVGKRVKWFGKEINEPFTPELLDTLR